MAKELNDETRSAVVKELIGNGISEADARRSIRILEEYFFNNKRDPDVGIEGHTGKIPAWALSVEGGRIVYQEDSSKDMKASEGPVGPYDHCPQRVRIGARTWKVRWLSHREWAEEKLDESNKGLTEVANSNIYIRTSRIYQDSGVEVQYDWQSLAETFLHECLHAMLWDTSLDRYPRSPNGKWDQEEYMVVQLAPRLQAFMLDNPHALEWVKYTATA